MMEDKKNAVMNGEVDDEQLDRVAGGRGMYDYYCCKCSSPAEKSDHNGQYYCMKHWKETPDSKMESESYVKPR